MAIIKKIKTFFTKETVYPITVEEAIYDKNGIRLDNKIPFKFGIDANGNYGYIKDGADTVIPFKKGVDNTYTDIFSYNQFTDISNLGIIKTGLKRIDTFEVHVIDNYSNETWLIADGNRRIYSAMMTFSNDELQSGVVVYSHPTSVNSLAQATNSIGTAATSWKNIIINGGVIDLRTAMLAGNSMLFSPGSKYLLTISGEEEK